MTFPGADEDTWPFGHVICEDERKRRMSQPPGFDDKAARRVEAVYTTADVVAQRRALLEMVAPRPGERVLDLGAGPGFMTLEAARIVGEAGVVVGVDKSAPMLTLAEARCASQPHVSFREADALSLPFEDGGFDVAIISQVYEYVTDMEAALAELFRVLRPGGRALIMDTDWGSLVWNAEDAARAKRIFTAWDAHLADPHLPRRLSPLLHGAGFEIADVRVLPLLNTEYPAENYSYGMVSVIVPFVIRKGGVPKEEAKAWAEDLMALGERGEYFFSLSRYVFLARKPEA